MQHRHTSFVDDRPDFNRSCSTEFNAQGSGNNTLLFYGVSMILLFLQHAELQMHYKDIQEQVCVDCYCIFTC